MRRHFFWVLVLWALPALAAERTFDFGQFRVGQTPPGFRSTVAGQGQPGDWQVLMDSVPSPMPALASQAPSEYTKAVLAQVAQDPTDEHFPLLILQDQTFGDFTLTTRFKTVRGVAEQMAGIAFRVQDEKNYYVVRASSLGKTFRFYKVLNGQRGPLVGPELPIPSGVWHELTVECQGSRIRCLLNGKELVSVNDKANALLTGKVGFWTKSDSVSYFTDLKIIYTPVIPPAQELVSNLLKQYPRLLGLEVFIRGGESNTTRLIASKDATALGKAGGKAEMDVITRGATYYGKENGSVSVVMPLRDRNGDTMAAVRVIMKTFPGQTEENAIVRAVPIVKKLQSQATSLQDLTE